MYKMNFISYLSGLYLYLFISVSKTRLEAARQLSSPHTPSPGLP